MIKGQLSKMTREEIVNLCRYYKGGETNPYERKDNIKAMLWHLEFGWVCELMNERESGKSGILEESYDEYTRAGLADFKTDSSIPASLRAYIFHCWQKSSYDGNPEAFKKFYSKHY